VCVNDKKEDIMANDIGNQRWNILQPVSDEVIERFKKVKQDHNEIKLIQNDLMSLEIGVGLIPLVTEEKILMSSRIA